MKKIYFVRHGESEGNIGSTRPIFSTPLTEKGKSQANFLAGRCKNLSLEIIICSTMNRARETAQSIVEKISKPIEYSDLFIERRQPSEIIGKPKNDLIALEIERVIHEKFHTPGFRVSDEENFDDIKNRAKQALGYLAQRPQKNILVITHGFFLRIVAAYVTLGDKLTGEEGMQFIRKFRIDNTGITVFGYDETKDNPSWWLWVWNDHAHLV